ncbi:MAG: metal-dependent transcriptional regulator [Planctomycetes bacterium]|nr:metal-dependent transcriptional regulator [Planctomycetota bacterium]MBL7147111.1 metal-dependent transcriptional regulator [Phycisphaerae bacterium]
MNINGKLSASLEDYLEAIFWIIQSKGAARAKDIAKRLRVKASSVTGALQALGEKNYINYAPYDVITLTSEGLEVAKKVVRHHRVLKDFFTTVLGIDAKIAEEGACKLEHGIPQPIVERLIEFMEFVEICPRGGTEWINNFVDQCKASKKHNCERCLEQSVENFKKEKLIMQAKKGTITLADLKPKQKAVVVKINRQGAIAKRLAEMGVGRGALVEVERVAPLGDPIEIKVKGYRLSLRKDEARDITISTQ